MSTLHFSKFFVTLACPIPSVIDSSPFFSGIPSVKYLNIELPCESVHAILILLFKFFKPYLLINNNNKTKKNITLCKKAKNNKDGCRKCCSKFERKKTFRKCKKLCMKN